VRGQAAVLRAPFGIQIVDPRIRCRAQMRAHASELLDERADGLIKTILEL
jgi:hypothetical protein